MNLWIYLFSFVFYFIWKILEQSLWINMVCVSLGLSDATQFHGDFFFCRSHLEGEWRWKNENIYQATASTETATIAMHSAQIVCYIHLECGIGRISDEIPLDQFNESISCNGSDSSEANLKRLSCLLPSIYWHVFCVQYSSYIRE